MISKPTTISSKSRRVYNGSVSVRLEWIYTAIKRFKGINAID